MIYLVTGPDNSGKDTVIKVLQSMLPRPAHVLHYSAVAGTSKEDVIEKSRVMYAQSIDAARYINNMLGADVIFNRFWEGETIYGPIYRGYTEEEAAYVFELETLNDLEVCGIHVTANPEVLLEREDGLSQSNHDILKITREANLFAEFCEKSRYHFTTINTSFTTEDDLYETIGKILDANLYRKVTA
jgi:thymidylate kinase